MKKDKMYTLIYNHLNRITVNIPTVALRRANGMFTEFWEKDFHFPIVKCKNDLIKKLEGKFRFSSVEMNGLRDLYMYDALFSYNSCDIGVHIVVINGVGPFLLFLIKKNNEYFYSQMYISGYHNQLSSSSGEPDVIYNHMLESLSHYIPMVRVDR